jgi:hypothetical protein
MGLLDEAIREHLELKRRSGADPSAVARAEHEALAPVFGDEQAGPDELARDAMTGQEDASEAHAVGSESLPQAEPFGAGASTVGEETAELDMRSLIEGGQGPGDGDEPLHPSAAGPAQPQAGEGALEWSPSSRPGDDSQVDTPRQGSVE